jgi:DNA mismatch endonuclease (patch repair protein)
MGYRFKVNERRFGFRPDMLFTSRRKAIFIHGCFWHGHEHAGIDRTPRTRSEIWRAKLAANKARDQRALEAFCDQGWRSLVIWECEVNDRAALAARLSEFLGPTRWSTSAQST